MDALLGGTAATRPQYRQVPRAPIRRQGGGPPPAVTSAPSYGQNQDAADYARARALFERLLGPQITALSSLYAGRAKAGMGAISGYTQELAKALMPLAGQVGGIYAGAEQSQAASDAALRQALAGGGQGLANDLQAKLTAINAPGAAVHEIAGGQAGIGAGAGNAQFASGSAELGRLIGNSAADQVFAAKQPGIAGFAGLQAGKQLQGQLQGELAGKVADLQGKQGAFVESEVQGRRASRAAAAKQQQAFLIAQDKSAQAWAKIKQGNANADDLRTYRQNLLYLKQQGLISTEEYRAQSLALRQRGQDITARGQDLRAAGKTGGLTPDAAAKLSGTAYTIAEGAYKGGTYKGQPAKPLGYQQAINEMRKDGVPLEIALKALDSYYKPGERGRPFLNIYERQALLAAGANPDAVRYGTFNAGMAKTLRQTYAKALATAGGQSPLAASEGSGLAFPLATKGQIIGRPYQGTHTLYGNWESDNAVDIAAKAGTPVYAVADGTIGSQLGSLGKGGNLAGDRVHLVTSGNEFYYAHLASYVVKAGQRVRRGQLLGYTGALNHLHIASRRGDPQKLLGV